MNVENSFKYFENRACRYYPCHEGIEEMNCLFCYCPMYFVKPCPGNPVFKEKDGLVIKDCTGCTFPHRAENYDAMIKALSAAIRKKKDA